MSKYDKHPVPQTCIVFGTGPANDEPDLIPGKKSHQPHWIVDETQRAQAAVEMVNRGTSNVICVGGERFKDGNGHMVTEAESVALKIANEAGHIGLSLDNVNLLLEKTGRETLEQVELVAQLLRDHNLMHGVIGIVSSWHQIPRVQYILKHDAHLESQAVVANPPELNGRLIPHAWNLVAGFAYTALALEMQRSGFWDNGGPVINYYRAKRTKSA